jgi:mannose-6-phosphate isomerase
MIYHLEPNIQRKIWGGENLEHLKNLPFEVEVDPVGETWEISIHPDGPSLHNGKKLNLEISETELPYLVKLLDTGDELSVQVHPPDEYARLHENSSGKTECWLVLKADKNSGIYLGLEEGVTKESFKAALDKMANMNEYLNFYPVSPGDFFYVPAGTIHSIGRGILLAEVQQSSGITYRVWDWNRLDSSGKFRDLHVAKSMDVINFDPAANTSGHFKITHDLFTYKGKKELINHPSFKMSLVNLDKNHSIEIDLPDQKRLCSILNFQGVLKVNEEVVKKYSAVLFKDVQGLEKKITITATEPTSFLFLE